MIQLLNINSNGGWSETRFWNGSAWVAPGQVIDGNLLVTGTIGAAKISANAITAEKIATDAITADKISANAITAAKISAGAITADKLTVSNLSAVSAAMGTLTSGRIQSPDGSFVIDFTNKYINITSLRHRQMNIELVNGLINEVATQYSQREKVYLKNVNGDAEVD